MKGAIALQGQTQDEPKRHIEASESVESPKSLEAVESVQSVESRESVQSVESMPGHSGGPSGGRQPNVVIQGTGKSSGGVFHNVNIQGVGHLDGDVECDKLSVSGVAKVKGALRAKRLHSQGKLTVDGKAEAAHCRADGHLTVHGDCTSEEFEVNGAVTVDGLLNSGSVKISLYQSCKIREIGGGTINVRLKRTLFGLHKLRKLTVDTLEADAITIENTHARVVRGNTVRILAGCEIGEVEYKEDYQQHESAIVGHYRKV